MALSVSGPVILGRLGPGDGARLRAMVTAAGEPPELLARRDLAVYARGGQRSEAGDRVAWSHGPLPASAAEQDLSAEHDVVEIVHDATGTVLRASPSGALPLYVETDDDGALVFASRLELLLATRPRPATPDWSGLLQMVTASGPLAGRTTVSEVRRLAPAEEIRRGLDGTVTRRQHWSWPEIERDGSTLTDVSQQLAAEVGRIARERPVISMLSGGWDSRLLLALAHHTPGHQPIRALTTSSDTGTVMEELVAAQVAEQLGAGRSEDAALEHRVIMPRRDQLEADLRDFAAAADYQTAFHVWLVPLARALATGPMPADGSTVLDGLGGGLFLGGAFADDPAATRPAAEQRLAGILRYLSAADGVLRPEVVNQARDRITADAEPVIRRYLDHPYGHTFAAYLTRTLPGISLAPHGLVARTASIATPYVNPAVVRAALGMAPAEHADGRLYPELVRAVDPVLAEITTAQDQVPWPRPHPRRTGSLEAARALRSLLLREPVRALLAPELLAAGPGHWRRLLATTGGQHLLRGLAVLSLWCESHEPLVRGIDVEEVTR